MFASIVDVILSVDFFNSSLRLATPLLLAAMGGILAERSGVLNLGLEGTMLMGAFSGFVGAYYFGNPWIGLIFAVVGALIFGLIHAFSTITLAVDQVVTAVAINLLGLGLTSSLLRVMFGTSTHHVKSAGFEVTKIPILGDIPILGPIFFNQSVLVYIGLILVPLVWVILFKTNWGLKIRAVGEYPRAADTLGVKVRKVRYICVLWSSAMAGLAGASLSITGINMFLDNMSAGRGFIAFAAIIFGKFNPIGVAAAVLVFGMADALQLRVQALGMPIPYQFPLMFPYVLTLVALAIVGAGVSPGSWGVPYKPEEE